MARTLRGGIASALIFIASLGAFAQTTRYAYDEAGNRTSQVDALGRRTEWTYDALKRKTSRTLPDGTRQTFSYDTAGNLTSLTTFAGESFHFTHSAAGFPTGHVIPPGSGTNSAITGASISSTYSPSGRLLTRLESGPTTLAGQQTYKYDLADRLVEAKSPIGTITYGRYPGGLVKERSIAGYGTVKYEYDDAGRMTVVVAPDGKMVLYEYDDAGRLEWVRRQLNPKGGKAQWLYTAYKYDTGSRLIWIAHSRQVDDQRAIVLAQRIARGRGGVIDRITTSRGGPVGPAGMDLTVEAERSYSYDAIGRLNGEISALESDEWTTTLEHDAVGNRARAAKVAGSSWATTSYKYDSNDRLVEEVRVLPDGTRHIVTRTWDSNGNLASKVEPGKATLYRFDPRDRLIDIRVGPTVQQALQSAPALRYAYDGDGHRIRKWLGERWTEYLVDVEEPLAQVVKESSAGSETIYLRGIQLLRQSTRTAAGTEDLFPLEGLLGTVLGAVNADGELVERSDTDAFGVLRNGEAPRQPHLFAGEYRDADSGLVYLRARWYDPQIGRFISADPFEGEQRDPRTLNRYAYAHGDPLQYSDRTGLFAITDTTSGMILANLAGATSTSATATVGAGLAARLSLYMIGSAVGTYVLGKHAERKHLEECMESSKKGEHKCKPDYPMFIVGDSHNEVRDHIGSAISEGKPNKLSRKEPGHDRDWIEKFKGPGRPCNGGAGTDCDEYPWAASMQGGANGNVSLRSVLGGQNKSAGAHLRWFHDRCKIPSNVSAMGSYIVIPIVGAMTGYVCGK